MKVILIADVKSIGKTGDVVNAADGHARNFLLPRKLAVEANTANMNRLAREKEKENSRKADELAKAQVLARRIEGHDLYDPGQSRGEASSSVP